MPNLVNNFFDSDFTPPARTETSRTNTAQDLAKGCLHITSNACFIYGGVTSAFGIAGLMVACLATSGIAALVIGVISSLVLLSGLGTLISGGIARYFEDLAEPIVSEATSTCSF